ncbi:YggS family pyridoxal phosphate-dependent enzyme [Alkalihalobacillus oceani]|uniref:YggS family pyridoxal phosphate-dependent enzyme n=1 Tax=Halalkalibacter oceani TaxID=1653776 RepID=UPI00204165FF|nr:YggS family pyridoxal phosphate-dependent enzyme [Halalkalibacter oceani]
MSVKQNGEAIQAEIDKLCARCGRDPNEINIVAVTKYVSVQTAQEALSAGFVHIGENRAEGLGEKWDSLQGEAVWHFIGSLQSKKVKKVIDKIDYLHSLDRISLAKELDKRLEHGKQLKCFVQVNVSGEESKAGLAPAEVIPFIRELEAYQSLQVVGLMTMAPFVEEPEETRAVFRRLRLLKEEVSALNLPHAPCQELSMGMSNDYQVAIEEGATFIRIGSALVGREADR